MSRLVAEVMSCVYIDYQAMVKVSPSCTKIKSKIKRNFFCTDSVTLRSQFIPLLHLYDTVTPQVEAKGSTQEASEGAVADALSPPTVAVAGRRETPTLAQTERRHRVVLA